MDTTKRFLTVGEVASDINENVAKPGTLKTQLMQTLVQEEPLDWRKELSDVFRYDNDVEQKIRQKLNIAAPSLTNAIPAARRYYLCNDDYNDINKIKDVPHYGRFMTDTKYAQYPANTFVGDESKYAVVKKSDVYRHYMKHDFYEPELIDSSAAPGTALADYSFVRANDMEDYNFGSDFSTPFYLKTLGREENLAPLTVTTPQSWTHTGSMFQVNPRNDYHFGFDLNLLLTCSEESTKVRVIDSRNIFVDSNREVATDNSSNINLGRCEVHVFARLHNAGVDDIAQYDKLNMSLFKPFTRIAQANWLIKDMQGSKERRTIRLQGGFRLRSIIDDCISSDFMYAGGEAKDRPYFKNVDIFLLVTTRDYFIQGGPMAFRLVPLPGDAGDKSNFIDVVDLGDCGVRPPV